MLLCINIIEFFSIYGHIKMQIYHVVLIIFFEQLNVLKNNFVYKLPKYTQSTQLTQAFLQ